jgi:hypothetical protein
MEDRLDGVGERAPREDVAHLEEARDADALVVRRQLVARDERPASFHPTLIEGPMPRVKTTGSPGTRDSAEAVSSSMEAAKTASSSASAASAAASSSSRIQGRRSTVTAR